MSIGLHEIGKFNMNQLINIYCDESCHLESTIITTDNRSMVLGGFACSEDKKQTIFQEICDFSSPEPIEEQEVRLRSW